MMLKLTANREHYQVRLNAHRRKLQFTTVQPRIGGAYGSLQQEFRIQPIQNRHHNDKSGGSGRLGELSGYRVFPHIRTFRLIPA